MNWKSCWHNSAPRNLICSFIPVLKMRRILWGITSAGWKPEYLLPDHLFILRLDIITTTKCNLHCRGCNHMMEYYDSPSHADTEVLLAALQKINECTDGFFHYSFLGGEPFLNPDLKYLLQVAPSDRCEVIQIVSNGTICPKDPELLAVMREKNVSVTISQYPQFESRQREVISWFQKQQIQADMYAPVWKDYGEPVNHGGTDHQILRRFCRCDHKGLPLLNGRLFYCARSAHCDHLGFVHANSVDLLHNSTEENRRQIRQMMNRCTPLEACRYCLKGTPEHRIIQRGAQNDSYKAGKTDRKHEKVEGKR